MRQTASKDYGNAMHAQWVYRAQMPYVLLASGPGSMQASWSKNADLRACTSGIAMHWQRAMSRVAG